MYRKQFNSRSQEDKTTTYAFYSVALKKIPSAKKAKTAV